MEYPPGFCKIIIKCLFLKRLKITDSWVDDMYQLILLWIKLWVKTKLVTVECKLDSWWVEANTFQFTSGLYF